MILVKIGNKFWTLYMKTRVGLWCLAVSDSWLGQCPLCGTPFP